MRRPPPPKQQQSSTLNTSAHSAETRADPFPCVAQASKRGDEQAQSRASRRRPWLDEKERVANTWAKSCAAGLYLKPRETRRRQVPCELNAQARAVAIVVKPTLRQAWSREDPGPQCAFKMSMFNESCNSH